MAVRTMSKYYRHTKIVCTVGPATSSSTSIERVIKAGMNVARLNLSHGNLDQHSRYIELVRKISKSLSVTISVLIDLPGPKYRIGNIEGGSVALKKGNVFVLTSELVIGDSNRVSVNFPTLTSDIRKGNVILLDDGAIQLKAVDVTDEQVEARVTVGGVLRSGRGIAVPGMRLSTPFMTEQLKKNLNFAISRIPDFIALSFVSTADDIEQVKEILKRKRADIPVISKIERREAVANFDAILAVSDGIMVARGDLGVDIPLEKIPLIQKDIIKKCNQAGKLVITATQMLESMVNSPRPTRAEVTDVANAILDGTDAIMLSAETSIGKYPVQAVTTMARIAEETELELPYELMLSERGKWLEHETDELISYSACYTAHWLGAKAVIAFTSSGSTARRVSKYRPRSPVLAITPIKSVTGKLVLYWGIIPYYIPTPTSIENLFKEGAKIATETGVARKGDIVVITGGIPVGIAGTTNLLKVEKVP